MKNEIDSEEEITEKTEIVKTRIEKVRMEGQIMTLTTRNP